MNLQKFVMMSVLMISAVFAAQNESTMASQIAEFVNLQKACDGGNPKSCDDLGWLYEHGEKHDYFKAVNLYSKACNAGFVLGCYNLGEKYEYDYGVKQNYLKAVELYQKSCTGGADGCMKLGWMYEDGRGVLQSKNEALNYFGKACDLKHQGGCADYAQLKSGK